MGSSRQSVWAILNRQATATQRGKAGKREPAFATIKKIMDALGIEMKVVSASDPDPDRVIQIAEQENIGYGSLERILGAAGLHIDINFPQ